MCYDIPRKFYLLLPYYQFLQLQKKNLTYENYSKVAILITEISLWCICFFIFFYYTPLFLLFNWDIIWKVKIFTLWLSYYFTVVFNYYSYFLFVDLLFQKSSYVFCLRRKHVKCSFLLFLNWLSVVMADDHVDSALRQVLRL